MDYSQWYFIDWDNSSITLTIDHTEQRDLKDIPLWIRKSAGGHYHILTSDKELYLNIYQGIIGDGHADSSFALNDLPFFNHRKDQWADLVWHHFWCENLSRIFPSEIRMVVIQHYSYECLQVLTSDFNAINFMQKNKFDYNTPLYIGFVSGIFRTPLDFCQIIDHYDSHDSDSNGWDFLKKRYNLTSIHPYHFTQKTITKLFRKYIYSIPTQWKESFQREKLISKMELPTIPINNGEILL